MFNKRIIFVAIALLILICPLVSAGSFQQVINQSYIDTYYNISYVQMPVSTVPLVDVLWLASVGIILLVLSLLVGCDKCNDILAIMAVFPLGVASWRFQTVDIVESGVASTYGTTTSPSLNEHVYVMMTQHNSVSLYHEGIMCSVFFIIALFNVYRILMINRELAAIKAREDGGID